MLAHPLPKEADMPTGIFPVPQFHSHASPSPTLGLRLRTRWSQNRLDRELASGADPASSPELTLRATQLQSQAGRSRHANAIVEMLGRAYEPNLGRFTVAGEQQHAEIEGSTEATDVAQWTVACGSQGFTTTEILVTTSTGIERVRAQNGCL